MNTNTNQEDIMGRKEFLQSKETRADGKDAAKESLDYPCNQYYTFGKLLSRINKN